MRIVTIPRVPKECEHHGAFFFFLVSLLVKAAWLARLLVALLFLSLGKFRRHQFLSALAHPAQGRPHVFPAEAQNPAHVWPLRAAGRALCLRDTSATEGGDGGPGCSGMLRDAPGCPGMLRRVPALPRLPARGRPRRTLGLRQGWMPFSKRRGRDSPRDSGSTVVNCP